MWEEGRVWGEERQEFEEERAQVGRKAKEAQGRGKLLRDSRGRTWE